MKDLIIKATVPVITGNFEVVKQQMLEGVKQYDVIITIDTVRDGKAMATELNKMKSMIKEVQKKHLDELTGPIAEFKDQIKELVDIAEDARQKILDQVKVFEDQQRELHLSAMTDYLKEQIEEQQLTEEFSGHLHCKDFVSITGLTTKGSLTKKSRDQIDLIVSRALQLQTEAKLESERKQREEDIRVENRARELAAEQAKTPEPEPEPEPEQKDTFGIVDDVIPEQREPAPEQQPQYEQPSFNQSEPVGYATQDAERTIGQDGKTEFIAEVKILLRAPVNMPKDKMAQAVLRTLEAQGVTDIQDVTIL